MSSDDGHMSDYDFVDIQESGYSSDDTDTTVTSSLAPPKGWSTLSLSDADAVKTVSATSASAAACARRKFISAVPASPTAALATATSTNSSVSACLECSVCNRLLRDCVECPTCHSLFCRSHLRVGSSGKSPCPCEPCGGRPAAASEATTTERAPFSTAIDADDSVPETTAAAAAALQVHHPASAFLPNIPVQRMADAVPSSCEGCGASMSWGELGLHSCDQQLVPCEWCGWVGKRHLRDLHATTCPGKEPVARARHEALEARAELDLARRHGEEAERRASSAEMRASELEARLLAAEKALRQKDAEAAALRAEHMKKEDELQRLLREEKEKARVAAAAAEEAAEKAKAKQQQLSRRSSGRASASAPAAAASAAAAAPGATAPLGFAAMLNRAGFSPAAEPASAAAASASASTQKKAAAAAATQTAAPAPATRASGRSTSSTKGALNAAVQMARGSSSNGGGIMTDTASQAPVPSVEACLKPYLDRPTSLLEKKVVVFWPRQGRWYVGRPTSYKEATKEHRVEYDDGDMRDHVLAHRSWGLLG